MDPLDRTRQVLGGLPLFSQLPADQLDGVAASVRPRGLARGETLFRAGDPCTAFFCVASGQVKLTLGSPDGGEKILEIVSAGETFGEAVMFAGRPYPVTATALLASELLVVPASTVLDLVAQDPMFARRMLAGMAVRLHTMIDDVHALSLRTGAQRVVGLLLSLAGEAPAAGTEVTLPAGKAVLASRLNLTPETFSRALRDLSSRGLVRVSGRRVGLLDPGGLLALTDAVPR